MPDSTPGSTENQPEGQQPSPETTQQPPADSAQSTPPKVDLPSSANDNSAGDNSAVVQNDDDKTTKTDDSSQQSGDDNQNQDEVADWAKKQGIDLDNPTPEQAKTLAKRLRDTQAAYHQANSKAKQADTSKINDLFKEDAGDEFEDPVLKEVRENSAKVNGQLSALAFERFVTQTPEVTDELAGQMIEILQEEEKTYGKDAARLLSNNHNRLFTLAQAASADNQTGAAYDNGRKDERQNLAKAQQAAGPSSNAVSSAPASQKVTDKAIGDMSVAEYTEWRKTHNPWDVTS